MTTHADDSASDRTLWDVSEGEGSLNGGNEPAPQRQGSDSDVRFVLDPVIVVRRSLLNDLLAVAAPRHVFTSRVAARVWRMFASLLDDPPTPAVNGDELMRRFVKAGIPAHSLSFVRGSDVEPTLDVAAVRQRVARQQQLPADRTWVIHLCTINDRRDALAVAASLRRELRRGPGSSPLHLVVGLGSGDARFRRLMSRIDAGDSIVVLGDVADPTWLIAASDVAVLHPHTGAPMVPSRPRRRTIVLGAGEKARELATVLADRRSSNEVIGFVVDDRRSAPRAIDERVDHRHRARAGSVMLDCPVLGTFADLFHIAEKEHIQSIVVALDDDGPLPTETLFDLKTMGVEIVDHMRLLEQVSGRIHIDNITPYQVIFSDGFRRPRAVLTMKRLGDAALAAVGLVALAPVFFALSVLIRRDSQGPVFYRQLRIGLNGRPFAIWKFRSMFVDSEVLHAPVWASEADPRVTRIGRWMRTWRLDELPQLINVMRGEMSLVGPRPERPVFVQDLRMSLAYYDVRHTVRPGITGWAQVRFPYAASMEESYQKLQYDLFYVKHMSLRLDIKIAVETLRVMARGEGAR